MASTPDVTTITKELPAVPLTLEGYSVLHQMFRFRWADWRKLELPRQSHIAREFAASFAAPAVHRVEAEITGVRNPGE